MSVLGRARYWLSRDSFLLIVAVVLLVIFCCSELSCEFSSLSLLSPLLALVSLGLGVLLTVLLPGCDLGPVRVSLSAFNLGELC